ncbi:MAG: hypothetical protein K8T25_23225 [Planctomycetia bacterium]|nr:hypothetical protein [Planctomycetia bacterium]
MLFALLLTATPLLAQDPADGAAEEMPAAKKAADKAEGDKKPAPKKDAAKKAAPAKPVDPAVIAIRDSNPSTPSDLVRSIDALLSLDALPLAEEYFKKLAAMPLTEAQLGALGREFDAGVWFRISQTKSFGPEANRFVGSVFAALRKAQENPDQISQLMAALASPQEATRAAARADLMQTGRAAIGPLVAVLADPKRKAIQAEARAVLVAMGREAVEPLLAGLDGAGAELKPQIVAVLAQTNDPRAEEALLVESVAPGTPPAIKQLAEAAVRRSFESPPSQVEVAARLMRLIDDYMKAERRLPSDEKNTSELWRYDAASGQIISHRLPAEAAAAVHAAWLARRLRTVAPNSPIAEQWHLMANLHAAKLLGGLHQPLQQGPGRAALDRAVARGPAVIEPVLRQALEKNHVPAALAALEVLGKTNDPSLLASTGAAPNVLLKAASHGDRRIRLAALEAIAALKPTQAMAGSSTIARALLDFANFSGVRRAVVADPRSDRAHALGSLLDQCSFTTSVATTGREAFHEAAGSTEVELVLIVMTVERPDAEELLRQLRRDPRTARLPVGLIADPDRLYRAEGIALADPLTKAFVRPRDLPTMQERVAALEAMSGPNHVTHAERRQQAATALKIIAAMNERPQRLFDFQGMDEAAEAALYVPELTPAAIQVLTHCRTSNAQKALADLASSDTQPIATRQAAAAAFAESIKRHGIQLSIVEIQHQARLYDQAAALDQQSQDVLWSLLEAMQKAKSEVGSRKSDQKRSKLPQPL